MPNKEQKLPPKKNWKRHFYGKLSEENSLQNNFQKKSLPRNIWRQNLLYQKIFKRNLYPKIFEDKFLPKYVWRKILWQTRCEGKLSNKQTLNRNPVQTNSERNLYQRELYFCLPNIFWRRISTNKYLKRNLSPEKIFQKMFRPTLISKDSTKEALKRHSPQKIEEKPLPKSLSRDISLAKKIGKYMSPKKCSKSSSVPKKLKKHPHPNICKQTIITRNMAKIRTDEILGKNVFKFHQIRFLPCFLVKTQIDFFGGDVS